MAIKIFIGLAFVFIIYSLYSALYSLVKYQGDDSTKIVKALTWRVSLSLLLFLFIILSYEMGWIVPNTLQFMH